MANRAVGIGFRSFYALNRAAGTNAHRLPVTSNVLDCVSFNRHRTVQFVHTTAARLNETEASPPKNEELEALRKEHDELLKEKDELQDKYRRALAETENVRRRGQKQVEDAKVFAIQSFCKDLLEVADILNLAVESVDKSYVTSNNQMKSLYDGVVMTKDVLQKTFDRHGLKIVSPEGQRFDPNLHDAIFQVPKEQAKHEPGNVETVLKIGYSLRGRPVRAAQVGVVKM